MYEIREFERSDLEAITTSFNLVVESGLAFMTEEAVTQDQMFKKLEREEKVIVLMGNKSLIGCYMLRPIMPGRGSHIANATYLVAREFQSKGFGYQLGQHSIATAKALGYKAIQFNGVAFNNEAALGLWGKLGFEVRGTIPGGFRNKNQEYIDVCILHRTL